jgi:hypothetical protein
MYGFRANDPWNILIGKQVIQICFGKNDTIFNFDNDTSLSVEASFELLCGGRTLKQNDESLFSKLVGVLGSKVIKILIPNAQVMNIFFENETVLILHDTHEMFEAVQLNGPNIQIIV